MIDVTWATVLVTGGGLIVTGGVAFGVVKTTNLFQDKKIKDNETGIKELRNKIDSNLIDKNICTLKQKGCQELMTQKLSEVTGSIKTMEGKLDTSIKKREDSTKKQDEMLLSISSLMVEVKAFMKQEKETD